MTGFTPSLLKNHERGRSVSSEPTAASLRQLKSTRQSILDMVPLTSRESANNLHFHDVYKAELAYVL